MILASHAIIGAAVGRLFPLSPFYGFLAGLLSHYAMDAIPHWEYTLPSISKRKKLVLNLCWQKKKKKIKKKMMIKYLL